MSFLQIPDMFPSAHKNGIDDLIDAFFQLRTGILRYGTPIFAPYSTSTITGIRSINFPVIADDVQFMIALRQPFVDLNHSHCGDNTELQSRAAKFFMSAEIILVVLPDSGKQGLVLTDEKAGSKGTTAVSEFTELNMQVRGSIINHGNCIGFQVEEIEIEDLCPESLENVIEDMMGAILHRTLKNIRVPIPSPEQDQQVIKDVWEHLLPFKMPDFMQNRHI